jgi:osmotically-inducible protein OsmY
MKRSNGFGGLAVIALVAVLGVAGLATAGCSTNVSAGQQIDDATITASVKTKFAADTDVAAHNIDVDTVEGVVTLTGKVDTWDEKREAESIARGTYGVRSVVNNLTVEKAG